MDEIDVTNLEIVLKRIRALADLENIPSIVEVHVVYLTVLPGTIILCTSYAQQRDQHLLL